MVGSKDPGAAVQRVLVQTVDQCSIDNAGRVPDQQVVQNEAGQGMIGMAPGRQSGGDAKAESGLGEESPGRLIPAPTEVEVSPEDDGLFGQRAEQVPGLKLPSRGSEPSVPRRTSRIQVGTDHADSPAPEGNYRRYRHASLQDERQLDGMSVLQGQGGKDGVAAVTGQHAVPHRGGIPKAEAELLRCLHYVILHPSLGHQYPSGGAGAGRRYRGVAPVGFLEEDDEWGTRVRSQPAEITASDPGDDLSKPPPPDPYIPAENQQ